MILKVETSDLGVDAESAAHEVLARGGLVAYPTETYYGLGASPWSEPALARLLAAKGERGDKPLPLILASTAAALRVLRRIDPRLQRLAARFWPGPLTLVLEAALDLPRAVTAGTHTVAVRVPDHPLARALARIGGGALTSTSANPSGAPPPRTAAAAEAGLGASVDLILDGGETPGGLASTVLDLLASPPRIVRAGPVRASAIAEVLGVDVAAEA